MADSETMYLPDPLYFNKQKEITPIMRSIMIDWMMEVCMEFMMKRDSLYIAINLVDRFLSRDFNVKKADLQLVGVCCLFIAAK